MHGNTIFQQNVGKQLDPMLFFFNITLITVLFVMLLRSALRDLLYLFMSLPFIFWHPLTTMKIYGEMVLQHITAPCKADKHMLTHQLTEENGALVQHSWCSGACRLTEGRHRETEKLWRPSLLFKHHQNQWCKLEKQAGNKFSHICGAWWEFFNNF